MHRLVPIGCAAVVVWSASACATDHRNDAEHVDQLIKAMPGVAGTTMTYESSFENGQNFHLTVQLDARVGEEQAVAVSHDFVDQLQRHHLGGHRIELDFTYPATPQRKNNYLPDHSQATYKLGDNATPPRPLSGDDVGESTVVWLRAVRSPIAEYADLSQPTWDGPAKSRDISLTLKPGTPSAAAVALQHSDPALAAVTWRIITVTDPMYRPQEYTSKPHPPTDEEMTLWQQILDVVGHTADASGSTTIPVEHGQAETQVDVTLPAGPDSDGHAHQMAMSIADLAQQFGRPVQLTLRTGAGPVELIVGGCERHEPGHRPLPLEAEMSRAYEKC